MKSRSTYVGIILIVAAFTVSCMRPAEAPAASGSRSTIKITPNEVPNESASSDDELVGLLQEQNKRLKAQIQSLEKENAELKARLPEKQ